MPGFKYDKAPCLCVLGKNQHTGSHKACHRRFDKVERFHFEEKKPFTYADAQTAACNSAGGAKDPPQDLNEEEKACVGAQLDACYEQPEPDGPGLNSGSEVKKPGAPGKVNDDYEAYRTTTKSGTWCEDAKSMSRSSKLYFTQVVATPSGDAFLVGHALEQGSEPTFTRFAKAGDSGWVHLGDLGVVVYAAAATPTPDSPRPSILALGREGPLRVFRPGQAPIDMPVTLKDRSTYFESLCVASDGIYICGGQRQIAHRVSDRWPF